MFIKRKHIVIVALVVCLATQFASLRRLIRFGIPFMASVGKKRRHPHAGARDENGHWDYVPDVTLIRRRVLHELGSADSSSYFPLQDPELFKQVCQVPPGFGDEGLDGYRVLSHVQLNGPNPVPDAETEEFNNTNIFLTPTLPPTTNISDLLPPRILCAVYTTEKAHEQLQAIVDTWGWRCDGFFAASTKTVPDLGALDLPHLGKEEYLNMWQKTRSILAFIFDNYIDEFDYFHVAGDDTYLIVENLRNYLHLLEALEGGRDTRSLYLGLRTYFVNRKYGWEPPYNLGGPGYILNRIALHRFVTEALPTCRADETFPGEDMNVARCFFPMDIFPIDTADVAHRQRFHDWNPYELAVFVPKKRDIWQQAYEYWAKDHGWRVGLDLVSTQTVAFHHLKSVLSMKRNHALIYNSCPMGTLMGDRFQRNNTYKV